MSLRSLIGKSKEMLRGNNGDQSIGVRDVLPLIDAAGKIRLPRHFCYDEGGENPTTRCEGSGSFPKDVFVTGDTIGNVPELEGTCPKCPLLFSLYLNRWLRPWEKAPSAER